MEAEILELKGLIEKLRATDTELRAFGADSHRYEIGPTLSEVEIVRFESEHNITLPPDYRLYLQLVGDGSGRPLPPPPYDAPWFVSGAGPGYGVYPLPQSADNESLDQPFPFEEEVDIPFEAPYDSWESDIPGALEISTAGCASHTHLIVSGPQFGTVWEGYDYDHFAPTRQSFSQWMRAWAERALRMLANDALVSRLAVGMTQEQVVAAVGGTWKERKNEYAEEYYFESSEIPAQLILSGAHGVVTQIKPWPFI